MMQPKAITVPQSQSEKRHLGKSENKVYILILFLLSPLFALLIAIKNYKSSWSKNIVLLFICFYGYTFVISNDEIDANRYRDYLIDLSKVELTLSNFSTLLYNEETSYVDVVQPLLTFIVSRYTSDYKILFLVFAFVFGYFYTRNIWFLLNKTGNSLKTEALPFIVTFIFIIGFWQINGFRMWTAAHIFFFGAIHYIIDNKKKGFILAALSIFVHFSFVLPTIILLIYSITRNRVYFYFFLYLLTSFIVEIDLEIIKNILTIIVPEFLQSRLTGYTNENYIEGITSVAESRNWYILFYEKALKWVIILFLSSIYYKSYKFVKSHEILYNLFSFTLIILTLANIASQLPSGGRFGSVANLFAVAFIFLFLQSSNNQFFFKRLIFLSIPALIFYCIVSLRIGLDTIGIMTVIGNPLISIFVDVNIALIELVK